MKKNLVCFVLIIVMGMFIVNINTYAVTLPELKITSNNYSIGEKINLEESNILDVKETLQLYAITAFGNDMIFEDNIDSLGWFVDKTNLNEVIWTSSNEHILKVDKNGKVTGISEGNATITAKYNEEYATYKITVDSKNDTNYNNQSIHILIILFILLLIIFIFLITILIYKHKRKK